MRRRGPLDIEDIYYPTEEEERREKERQEELKEQNRVAEENYAKETENFKKYLAVCITQEEFLRIKGIKINSKLEESKKELEELEARHSLLLKDIEKQEDRVRRCKRLAALKKRRGKKIGKGDTRKREVGRRTDSGRTGIQRRR